MNTQAHAVVNLTILGAGKSPRETAAILLGSVLPDLQIVAFYIVEKAAYGTSEAEIWGRRYFEVHEYFDWLNSIPLAGVALALGHWTDRPILRGLSGGVLLHCLADLLCHNDDAHRHFLPLSGWRFESPISYWDPGHFGLQFSVFETALVIWCCWMLAKRHPRRWPRVSLATVAFTYGLFWLGMAIYFGIS